MVSPLEFYGTTIIDDPLMGPRVFAFIKRDEEKSTSHWPMTAEYITNLINSFTEAADRDDETRASLTALNTAANAVAEAERRNALVRPAFVFPDDHVFIQCDGYRTVNDPEMGPRVFAMLRQRFPLSGFVVRRPATADELQSIADHFQEHADGAQSDNHGMSKDEFLRAAEVVDAVISEVKSRERKPPTARL
jgi:hypothetical protein